MVRERYTFFNIVDSRDQTPVHSTQVTTHLHRNDTKMIFFVTPYQEGFSVVVENATARGPEATGIGGLQETITFLEQEVIIDKFLLNLFAHASQGVEGSLEFT